jgi:phosphatidylglycerol lysyltransferase
MTSASDPDRNPDEAEAERPSRWMRAAKAALQAWSRAWAAYRHPLVTAIVSLTIFLIALQLISVELMRHTLADLGEAFGNVGWLATGGAVLATTLSYGALTLNDRHCLSMLGKRLPWARTARASVAASAFANTLGFSWATAGAARLRLYRKWGLTPPEVGALSFATGAGVQIGGLAAAGLGLLVAAPEIADHGPIPAPIWWATAIVCLLPAAGWLLLAFRGPRRIDVAPAPLFRPPPDRAVAHLGAILVDWIAAAGVLYLLLPDHGGWSFPAFLAVFVLAGFLGALSGAPGGLGVFEAAILTLAPVSQDAPGAAVALLVYRLVYNIAPLACATLILGADAAAPVVRPAAAGARKVGAAMGEGARSLAPGALSVLVFLCGLMLVGGAAAPGSTVRLIALEDWGLGPVSQVAHVASALLGVGLMMVAAPVWRRTRAGWRAAAWGLSLGAGAQILMGLNWAEAAACLCVALGLAGTAGLFHHRARLNLRLTSPGWMAALVGGVAACVWLAAFAHQDVRIDRALFFATGPENDAARTLRAMAAACLLTAGFTMRVVAARIARTLRRRRTRAVRTG